MLNIVALTGRLTADPELRTTQSGISTCSFTLAVDRNYAPKGSERKADFINIMAWKKTAEFICKYFAKGAMIALTGSIQTRNYEDKSGNKRTALEVVASDVSFCGSKNDSNAADKGNGNQFPATGSADIDNFTEIEDTEDLPF